MIPYPVFRSVGGGAYVTSAGTSAEVAIPNASDGAKAKIVRIASDADAHVKPVQTGTAATTNDILVTNGAPIFLNVAGYTHIAYLENDTGAKINIVPVEF